MLLGKSNCPQVYSFNQDDFLKCFVLFIKQGVGQVAQGETNETD